MRRPKVDDELTLLTDFGKATAICVEVSDDPAHPGSTLLKVMTHGPFEEDQQCWIVEPGGSKIGATVRSVAKRTIDSEIFAFGDLCLRISMEEKPIAPSDEAGLHEYVDAEFTVLDLQSPKKEKAIQDILKSLPGLKRLSISHGKVMVHYEPVRLSRKQIEEAIQRAGFQISGTEAGASSPMTEAFTPKTKQPE